MNYSETDSAWLHAAASTADERQLIGMHAFIDHQSRKENI
jgi:hypothetical protein